MSGSVLSVLSSFALIPLSNTSGFFTLIVFLLSCDCYCSVHILRGTEDWSAVYDCKMPRPNSLSFYSPTTAEGYWFGVVHPPIHPSICLSICLSICHFSSSSAITRYTIDGIS